MIETIDIRIFKGFVRQVCDETNAYFGNNVTTSQSLVYESFEEESV